MKKLPALKRVILSIPVFAIVTVLALPSFSFAEMSKEELAKLAQNPVGNLISIPFQNNTNFNVGRTTEPRIS